MIKLKLRITPNELYLYNTETDSIYQSWSYEAMQKYVDTYPDGNIQKIFAKIWRDIREYEHNNFKIEIETAEK